MYEKKGLNLFYKIKKEEIILIYSKSDLITPGILEDVTASQGPWNGFRKEIFRDFFCDN